MDMLLLNQQSQLQVLQEIQKQLNTLLPGNALLNSNVYSLGLLLGQQVAAAASISCPLLNPSSLLSCEGASALSLSPASGALPAPQLPASQDPVASAARSALCCECVQCKHVWRLCHLGQVTSGLWCWSCSSCEGADCTLRCNNSSNPCPVAWRDFGQEWPLSRGAVKCNVLIRFSVFLTWYVFQHVLGQLYFS